MNKKHLVLGLVVIAFLLASTSGCIELEEIGPDSTEFEVSDLKLNSSETSIGETVEVSMEVENVGDQEGEYTVEVEVNDELFSKDVKLDAAESETVIFEVSKEEPGDYEVKVEDLSDTFQVERRDELEVDEFKFVEDFDVTDVDDWVEVEPEYLPVGEIHIYFEVEGFEVDDGGTVAWQSYVTVYGPDGEPVESFENIELEDGEDQLPDADWAYVDFTAQILPDEDSWNEGEHEVEFTVVDEVGEKELVFTESFEVVRDGELEKIPLGYYSVNNYPEQDDDFDSLVKFLEDFTLPRDYDLGKFDCSHMSAYMEWVLEDAGFDTHIAYSSHVPWDEDGGAHAWIIVYTDDYRVAIETTGLGDDTHLVEGIINEDEEYGDYYYNPEEEFSDIYEATERSGTIDQWNWWFGI